MIYDPNRTVTSKDFAIGVLGVTAVILLVALLTINALVPGRALAASQASVSGDFLVNTARLNDASSLLIVINTRQQLMNGYGFNIYAGQIDLIQQIDLERLSKDAQRFQQERRGGKPGQEGTKTPELGQPPKVRPRR
jgi:hypothetical protein